MLEFIARCLLEFLAWIFLSIVVPERWRDPRSRQERKADLQWERRRRRILRWARRRREGEPIPPLDLRCTNCGYELVGLTGDLCPECGEELNFEELAAHRFQEEDS